MLLIKLLCKGKFVHFTWCIRQVSVLLLVFSDDHGTFNFLEIALRSVLGEGTDYLASGGQVDNL